MAFIKELRRKCLTEVKSKFSSRGNVNNKPVLRMPIFNLSQKTVKDLNLSSDSNLGEMESELWNCYTYILHKGIAASIAARFGGNNIEFNYSFEDAINGRVPPYHFSLSPVKDEYSFNLRYHLLNNELKFQEIFDNIYDYIKASITIISEEGIEGNEIVDAFLAAAGLVGIAFTERIDLTKEDYLPIASSITIYDEGFKIDLDLEKDIRLGKFEEPLIENEVSLQIRCSFCGKPALKLPKKGDIWNEAVLEPCEHFAFAFITNTDNHFYGREYYTSSFKKAVIDYVETFKGFTCQADPGVFVNDLFNGDTDLDENDVTRINSILRSDLPDSNIQTKQFSKVLNGNNHVFVFQFMKFI